jgi:hypothetical protein
VRSHLRRLLRHLGKRLPYGVVGLGLLLTLGEAMKIVAGFDNAPSRLQVAALSVVAVLSFVTAFTGQRFKKNLSKLISSA